MTFPREYQLGWCPGPAHLIDGRGEHLLPCSKVDGHEGPCLPRPREYGAHDCVANACPLDPDPMIPRPRPPERVVVPPDPFGLRRG